MHAPPGRRLSVAAEESVEGVGVRNGRGGGTPTGAWLGKAEDILSDRDVTAVEPSRS